MYACMYYMHIYVCAYIYVYMHVCTCIYVHVYMYACVHTYIYVIFKLGFERYGGNCPSWEGELSGEIVQGSCPGGIVRGEMSVPQKSLPLDFLPVSRDSLPRRLNFNTDSPPRRICFRLDSPPPRRRYSETKSPGERLFHPPSKKTLPGESLFRREFGYSHITFITNQSTLF